MPGAMEIRSLRPSDYPAVHALWQNEPGVVIRAFDDSEAGFGLMVRYNPDLCLALWDGDVMVGAVLAGFDGRRAYVYHFVIAATHRRQGLGERLADALHQALARIRVSKAHLCVLNENLAGQAFWARQGWERRDELALYSRPLHHDD